MDDDILPANPDQAILDAIEAGNKLTAIKWYRMEHGVSLKEAKDQIDALATHRLLKDVSTIDSEIHRSLMEGAKLNAIRLYRDKYGVDLRTAHDRINALLATGAYPDQDNPTTRVIAKLVVFLLELALVAIVAYFINRLVLGR